MYISFGSGNLLPPGVTRSDSRKRWHRAISVLDEGSTIISSWLYGAVADTLGFFRGLIGPATIVNSPLWARSQILLSRKTRLICQSHTGTRIGFDVSLIWRGVDGMFSTEQASKQIAEIAAGR